MREIITKNNNIIIVNDDIAKQLKRKYKDYIKEINETEETNESFYISTFIDGNILIKSIDDDEKENALFKALKLKYLSFEYNVNIKIIREGFTDIDCIITIKNTFNNAIYKYYLYNVEL